MMLSKEFIWDYKIQSNDLIRGIKTDSWASISEHYAWALLNMPFFWKNRKPQSIIKMS